MKGVNDSTPYKSKDVMGIYGNSKDYKIAKLKRDFGDKEVMDVIADNDYTMATQVQRHFGVGKDKMSAVERVVRAYERLDEAEQNKFKKEIK